MTAAGESAAGPRGGAALGGYPGEPAGAASAGAAACWCGCAIRKRSARSAASCRPPTGCRPSAGSRGGVAHEVKNPLNAILLHVEVARAKLAQGDTDVGRRWKSSRARFCGWTAW